MWHIGTMDLVITRHKLPSLARSLLNMWMALISSLDNGTIQCSETDKNLIRSGQNIREKFEEVFQTSFNVRKPDRRVGISVGKVLESVLKVFNGQLTNDDIQLEICEMQPESRNSLLDLPFYVGENAFFVTINNAWDAYKSQSRNGQERKIKILIDASPGQSLICSVVDNGPGVPPELVNKLFTEPCPSDKPNSIGFGLYSAVNLLWAFNGDIRYERQKIGKKEYTVFQLIFPRSLAKPSTPEPA